MCSQAKLFQTITAWYILRGKKGVDWHRVNLVPIFNSLVEEHMLLHSCT